MDPVLNETTISRDPNKPCPACGWEDVRLEYNFKVGKIAMECRRCKCEWTADTVEQVHH
jgi:hypothetical protein